MSDKRKIRVGITQGDINGIGYEVILKTFATPEMFEICTPIVYGSPKAAAYHRKALEMDVAYNAIATLNEAEDGKLNIINCNGDEIRIELGNATKEAGQAAFEALERAVQDYKEGKVDVLVTAPINKSTIQNENSTSPGTPNICKSAAERITNRLCCYAATKFALQWPHRTCPCAMFPQP